MVGGSDFGRYPKISPEITYNMIITDGWMVNFPGYEKVQSLINGSAIEGRSIYSSKIADAMFAVIDNTLYKISSSLTPEAVGTLDTSNGDVFMSENNAGQIELCDKQKLYCYDYNTGDFSSVPFPTTPVPYAGITYSAVSFQAVATLVGSSFTVGSSPITVISLGAYQNDSALIFQTGSVQVAIFNALGDLITSATIFPSTGTADGVNYVFVNPVVLEAGQVYEVIQTVAANQNVLSNGTIAISSAVTFGATLSAAGTALQFINTNTYGYTQAFGPTFQYATSLSTVTPLYVSFQDTRFLVPGSDGQWYLSSNNNGLIFPIGSQYVGEFQTKPDKPIAIIRIPGHGNKILIMGHNVTELWSDLGLELFPYQRDTFANIDYGCINPASIAALEDFVVWLAINEQAGPAIMYTTGQKFETLSTDGISFLLSNLTAPQDCYGFLFRQYGHVIYVLTFPTDNYSICFDFTTKKFFNLCDEHFNAFIAKRITFFNNEYYFVSIKDGDIYRINSNLFTFDGSEMPLVRIPPTFRLPDTTRFVCNNATFPIDQGLSEVAPVIELSSSRDGGYSYGMSYRKTLKPLANRPNRVNFYNLGGANELTLQFRFHSLGRTTFTDGEVTIYQ